jgi:hypothetical protein
MLMNSSATAINDWVQIPVNILDTSFYHISNNLISEIKIAARSVAYLSSLEKINQIIVGTISDDKLSENMTSIKIKLNKLLIVSIEKITANSKPWSNPRSRKL